MAENTTRPGQADGGAPDAGLTEALLREAGWVRSLARRLARDQAVADDTAQSAMAIALESRPDAGTTLRPWLARVVARLTRRHARSEARRSDRERRVLEGRRDADASDELLERLELQQDLAGRVRALPEPYRSVVLRRFYEGRTASEIGRDMGTSAATVRSQLARGLERLRRDFDRSHGDGTFHSGGALALLLLAAGSNGGLLSRTSLELMAMKSSTKIGVAVVLVAATLVATRGIVGSTPERVERTGDTTVLVDPGAQEDGTSDLADVDGTTEREELAEVATTGPAGAPVEAAAPTEDESPEVSTVRARLVDERGAPLPGAELRSIYSDGRPRGEACWSSSDADGFVEISIEDEFMRAYKTEVFPMAFRASARMRATVFVLSTPRWHGVTDLGPIELAEGGAVKGNVVDAAGRAIEGARIYVGETVVIEDMEAVRLDGPDVAQRRPRADSRSSGRFEFPGVAAGTYRLYAGADGMLWTITDPIEVSVHGTTDVGTIVLEEVPAEERITGVVLRPDGAPAAGAKVAYESQALQADGTLIADESGRITFCPGGPGDVEFVARDATETFNMSAPKVASRGVDDLVLQLRERRTIALSVVDDDGAPIASASCMAFLTDRDFFGDGGRPIPGQDWMHTGDDGVVLVPVPPIEFTLSASLTGYEGSRIGPFSPDSAPETAEIVLKSEPRISGRVLAYGQPVAGAKIKIAQRIEGFVPLEAGFPVRFFINRFHGIETDAEGGFSCPFDSEWTDVTILAMSDRYATGETEVTVESGAGAEGVVVEMTNGGSIAGVVLGPAGHDLGDLYVAASRGDGHPVWTRVATDGTYSLEGLTPGSWRVEGRLREPSAVVLSVANDPEDKEFNWNVEVVDGEESPFEVDMRGQGIVEVHGRLLIDGEPASGWRVTIEAEDERYTGRIPPTAELDESGSFVLGVPAGVSKLTIAGALDGSSRIEVLRELELEGTRVDWDAALTTGPVSETLEGEIEEVRVLRGVSSRGDCELTYFEPDAEGRITGRAVVGEGQLQSPRSTNFGRLWMNVRPIEVRPQ